MSKKNPKFQASAATAVAPVALSHAAEYLIIKHDLLRVVMLNAIYLVGVLTIYFTNQKSHYLDNLLSRWLHF